MDHALAPGLTRIRRGHHVHHDEGIDRASLRGRTRQTIEFPPERLSICQKFNLALC
jgi:hypothetical protein